MDEKTTELLFSVLGSAISEASLSAKEKQLCTDVMISEILSAAKSHDIDNIIYSGLLKNGLVFGDDQRYKSTIFKTIYRYENQKYELERLKSLLDENGIPYVPLKGTVLRDYYKDPWMRTSCDIDILIKKEDIEKAKGLIVNELNYECTFVSTHDISLMSQNKVHIELHFELKETDFKESPLLTQIWDGGELVKASGCEYAMTNEMFLFFHIYHMAKHFKYGGCGIKPFVDLWIIKNKMSYDENEVITLLKQEGLDKFYNYAVLLADVWFENQSHTEITKSMEDFILQGGVYGTVEQNLAMEQGAKGGAFKRLWGRIFMPYSQLKKGYKVLTKWPILYPFFQIVRWLKIIFGSGKKRAAEEIKRNQSVTQKERNTAKSLIDELGL